MSTSTWDPVIIARSYDPSKPPAVNGNGKAVRVLLKNELPTGAAGNLFLPVDPTMMGAGMGPVPGLNYTQNRMSTHLHGGATPWISDGTPHQWMTPAADPAVAGQPLYQKGASFQNVPDMIGAGKSIPAPAANDGMVTLYYSNQQSGRLMFYHDHAYGITRLNVYAGMAAGYLLTDQVEDDMITGTNVSGAFTTPRQVLPNLGGVYKYGIPLVVQDKTFVNDGATPPGTGFPSSATPIPSTAAVDPRWYSVGATGVWATGTTPPAGGKLWLPHEYMPNENIYDPSGALPFGRWDYGPWLNPAAVVLNSTLPSPTITPEAFMDTMLVNGTAYPYVTLPPTAVRFRILNACNDRTINLQLYVADPAHPTEVKMVPAAPGVAATWPVDGRTGGVPDPATVGPTMYQIGNEGGLLPQVAVIPPQPIVFEQSRQLPTVLSIARHALLLTPAERADIVVDLSAYAGQTLILYNDAPAASPLFDPRYDLFTNGPDLTGSGGPPSVPAGFGPNTRTVMQIRVSGTPSAAFDVASLQAALPKAYRATQAPPIVPQAAYNAAFGTTNTDTYVNNTDATVNLLGTAQGVGAVITTLGGSGYTTAPTVSFISANGVGSGAAATAALDGVTAFTVTTAGTVYTTPPAVTIAAPTGCGAINTTTCVTATAVASVSGGQVTAITVVDPGSGYTAECTAGTNPAVTIGAPGAGGVQAVASSGLTCGAVAHIQVTTAGTGYTKAPFVYLTGGGGTGATADARLVNDTVIGMKNITEGFDVQYGRMNVLLGTTPVPLDPTAPAPAVPGIAQYIDPPSDFWTDGQIYVFRIAHLGVDNHAVHFHLANLQVVNRVDYTNTMLPPEANELGWRETIRSEPFTDLIVAVKPKSMQLPFAIPRSSRLMDPTTLAGSTANFVQPAPVPGTPTPAGISNVVTDYGWEYVWHCHLLGHEENDMMRPIVFNPITMTSPTFSPAGSATPPPQHWTTATAVTFTAGTPTPALTGTTYYQFSLNNGTTNTVLPGCTYSTTTTCTMAGNATLYPAGFYTLTVDATNSLTAPVLPLATAILPFALIPPAATAVNLTTTPPSPASPHVNGAAITFTATPTGCAAGVCQYRFNQSFNGGAAAIAQDYSTTATYIMPLSTVAGPYSVTVDVRTNTLSATPDATSSAAAYTVIEGRDWNSDTNADILWRNTSTGQNAVWNMNDTTFVAGVMLPSMTDPNWAIVGTGDFNSDGKPDLLWRNTSTGQNAVWHMNNATFVSGATLPLMTDPNWAIVGAADFNLDGKPDILWRNTSTGQNAVWNMNDATFISGVLLSPQTDLNWKIVGTADFNSDGKPDILWRNTTTGQNAIWYMNGTALLSGVLISSQTDLNWTIVGAFDFNKDGKPDILWRNTSTGQNAIWHMNNATFVSGALIGSQTDLNWKIMGR